jgi:hypothetical protein
MTMIVFLVALICPFAILAQLVEPERPRLLRERPLDLETMKLGTSIPVDPSGKHGPKRVAGYYSLNRTKVRGGSKRAAPIRCVRGRVADCLTCIVQEAEMFYFFFESRNDPANDPVVLWMTGARLTRLCDRLTTVRVDFNSRRSWHGCLNATPTTNNDWLYDLCVCVGAGVVVASHRAVQIAIELATTIRKLPRQALPHGSG